MKRRPRRRLPIGETPWLQDGMFSDQHGVASPAAVREPLYLQPVRERSARHQSRRLREQRFRNLVQLIFVALAAVLGSLMLISMLTAIEAPEADTGTFINQLDGGYIASDLPGIQDDAQVFTDSPFTRPLNAPIVSAQSAMLIDLDERQVLYKKDAYARRAPASFSKIALAVTALQYANSDEQIKVPEDVLAQPSPRVGLVPGESLSLRDLLYALLLPSGNDAAVAIVAGTGGHAYVVDKMKTHVERLDLNDTRFVSPAGFDAEDQYTTAYDSAVLATDAMDRFPLLKEIVSTRTYVIPERSHNRSYSLKNLNELLWSYEGSTGMKTGTTDDAGQNLIASATRNGHSLMVVVMGSTDRSQDAGTLLDFGFQAIRAQG
ncbi:MAG TPA: hypothetical protein DGO43_03360 [Chloroflexi bacterium]|nr:hypothetical protein [Chloroflexota bacterium]